MFDYKAHTHAAETPFGGRVQVRPLRDGTLDIRTPDDEWLTINGVAYRLGYAIMHRQDVDASAGWNPPERERGTWQPFDPHSRGSWSFSMDRGSVLSEPTDAARRALLDWLRTFAAEWVAAHPDEVVAADRAYAESDANDREGKARELEAEAKQLRIEARALRAGGRVQWGRPDRYSGASGSRVLAKSGKHTWKQVGGWKVR